MTNVSTNHPYGIPYLELIEKGRKISFQKDCFIDIKILRKVNDGEWHTLVEQVKSPFIDADAFSSGTGLSYSIELVLNGEKKQYELEARL